MIQNRLTNLKKSYSMGRKFKKYPEIYSQNFGNVSLVLKKMLKMKYIDKNKPLEDLVALRDLHSADLGEGTLYQAVKKSKSISKDNFLSRATLESWIESRKLIRGSIKRDTEGKIVESSVNLDDVIFWTKIVKGFDILVKEKVIRKTTKPKGYKYINPNEAAPKGISPTELKIDAVIDILSSFFSGIDTNEKKKIAESILNS